MVKPPSLARILSVDYLAFSVVIVPIAAWGFYLVLRLFAPDNAGAWRHPGAPAALTGLSLLVLLWRVWLIRSVFRHGVEAPATVTRLKRMRASRTRINYVYAYAGRERTGGNTVSSARVPVTVKPGDTVTLLVDPNHPRRAFIRELYLG